MHYLWLQRALFLAVLPVGLLLAPACKRGPSPPCPEAPPCVDSDAVGKAKKPKKPKKDKPVPPSERFELGFPSRPAPMPEFYTKEGAIDLSFVGQMKPFLEVKKQGGRMPITVRVSDGDTQRELAATIEMKGRFRFKWCRYPPIGLTFDEDTKGTPFAGIDRLKLYPHCDRLPVGDKPTRLEVRLLGNETVVHRERFGYMLWNIVSGAGHGTRILNIAWEDNEQGVLTTAAALAAEPHAELADRYAGKRIDAESRDWFPAQRSEADPDSAAILHLFQILIGNHDWTFWDLNIRPRFRVEPGEGAADNYGIFDGAELEPSNVIALALPNGSMVGEPYDYDLSPLVLGYPEDRSEPQFGVGLWDDKAVDWQDTHLDLQGRFRPRHSRAAIDRAFATFEAAREDVYALLEGFDMDEEGRRIARRRLDNFYENIAAEVFYRETISRVGVGLYDDPDLTQLLCSVIHPGTLIALLERGITSHEIEILDQHKRVCLDQHRRTVKAGFVSADAVSADFPAAP